MIRAPRTLIALIALGLFVPAASLSFAADAAAKGTLKGKVLTADGKVAAGVNVRVLATAPKTAAKADKATGTAADETPAKPSKGKKKGAAAVAEKATETDGTYSIEVPAGDYTVAVADKVLGSGRAKVTVKEGETVNVPDITLKESKKAK
jgi:hypothetical protein